MAWQVGERIDPRIAYGEALVELGENHNNLIVLDADLQRSNRTFEFGQKYPDRFFDLGIAEADMVSTAAGMASMDCVVFATSFAMFLPGRCYDQIRLQVAYANSNVKLVGVSAGLTIGPDGASHQSLDDIALMRQLPHMTVLVPADALETYQAVFLAAELNGPVYIRVSRYPSPIIHDVDYVMKLGAPEVMARGEDVTIFASGIMVNIALEAAKILRDMNIYPNVINLSTLKPLNSEAILSYCANMKLIVSLEEHNVLGGVGGAIAEVLAGGTASPRLLRIGVDDCFGQSGSPDELLDFYCLTPNKIASRVLSNLE